LLEEQWLIGRRGAFCAAIRDWTIEATAGGELQLQYPAPNLLQWGAGIGVSRRFQLMP
jgi:hypothetical protein